MKLKKIHLGSYIIIAVLLFFCFKLWQLQVLEGDKYRALSESNRLRIVKTPAPRGIIFDRNGTPLVKDVPFFSVSISPETLKGLDPNALAVFLSMDKKEIEEKLNRKDNSPFIPIKLKQGLSFQEVAHIEAGKSDFPGLFVETDVGREYLFGKVGAHIIGYLGKMTSAQFDNPEFRGFPPDALIGQWGVEAVFDKELRGTPGEKIIEVDALGRELRLIQQRPSIKGNNIELSIDINIQKAVEDGFKDKAGALVAIKPDTGEILALESLPSFDPNVFSRGITYQEWVSLMEDKKNPMLNRALQSQYPPGSTFKIITATAALEEGVIDLDKKINCTGGIKYGKWTFGCWKKGGHGPIDFHRAIVESCDSYFYEVGRRLGIDKIYKYATALGLGRETGLDLLIKERRGLIPNTEWKRQKKGSPWYLGETYNAAIGQGYVTVTPIQMARMMATFSNGGTIYPLSLLKGGSQPVGQLGIKPETIQIIKEALAGVVNEPNGTAHAAQSQALLIGGKTGTAQVVGKQRGFSGEKYMDHAWFVAFAPVDKPEIALSVFVEHGGHGATTAAPIAKRAIEAYLVKPKPVEAATAGPIKKAGDFPAPSPASPGSGSSTHGNNENAQGDPE
ncbi:MAG: penicillin-binding protein 2 [Nitrospirae bacterium]|nr:penicillin-binding protein 2 [Nitrospirota bacterium]